MDLAVLYFETLKVAVESTGCLKNPNRDLVKQRFAPVFFLESLTRDMVLTAHPYCLNASVNSDKAISEFQLSLYCQ
jgi:hypothetical protein